MIFMVFESFSIGRTAVFLLSLLMLTLPIKKRWWQFTWLGLAGFAGVWALLVSTCFGFAEFPSLFGAAWLDPDVFLPFVCLFSRILACLASLAFLGFHMRGKRMARNVTAWILAADALLDGVLEGALERVVYPYTGFGGMLWPFLLVAAMGWGVLATCEGTDVGQRQETVQARRTAGKIVGAILAAGLLAWGGIAGAEAWQISRMKRLANSVATKTITLPGGAEMEMVWCPPGSFTMGSPAIEEGRSEDETQHQVTISQGFWMAKTEVTQKQWKSVMGNNPSWVKGDDLPVGVTWEKAQAFCRESGLQLPTEAQWEYACRAGSPEKYGGTGVLRTMGWYRDNSWNTIHPVGQKAPNAWGLYDMHGNVWEWCADWFELKYYDHSPEVDPEGPDSGSNRVLRGGSCDRSRSWREDCRSASRSCRNPGDRGEIRWGEGVHGFRPVALQD